MDKRSQIGSDISKLLKVCIKGLYKLCHPFSPMPASGGYFLVKGYWPCAAGLGRIFTAGLTIMGLHFSTVTRMVSHIFGISGIRKFW